MFVSDPLARYGDGEVCPITLDTFDEAEVPVELSAMPGHFFSWNDAMRTLRTNPLTRQPIDPARDLEPVLTPQMTYEAYLRSLRRLYQTLNWNREDVVRRDLATSEDGGELGPQHATGLLASMRQIARDAGITRRAGYHPRQR